MPIKSSAMARVQPAIVNGAAKFTRAMRKSPKTRILVKTGPEIVRRTNHVLKKLEAKGKKPTRALAGKVMAMQTHKVLGNPKTCAKAIVKSSQKVNKITKKPAMARR
jgi:hypothetical protein